MMICLTKDFVKITFVMLVAAKLNMVSHKKKSFLTIPKK